MSDSIKKLRVALQFSGQLRYVKKTYDSIKTNILDVLNPDVFIHSWSDVITSGIYNNPHYYRHIDSTPEEFIEMYRPKGFIFEKVNPLISSFTKEEHGNGGWKNVAYILYLSNQIRKIHEAYSGTKYDLIIRLRTDLEILNVDYSFLNNLNENSIFIPSGFDHGNGINDQIAFLGSKSADIYHDLVMNQSAFRFNKELYDAVVHHNNYHTIESMLKIHLHLNKLPIDRINLKYKLLTHNVINI